MTREEGAAKAPAADRLLRDEGFQQSMADIRAECLKAFEDSGPDDTGTREEAHALLRAITKLQQKLSATVSAESVAAKRDKQKEQHRG